MWPFCWAFPPNKIFNSAEKIRNLFLSCGKLSSHSEGKTHEIFKLCLCWSGRGQHGQRWSNCSMQPQQIVTRFLPFQILPRLCSSMDTRKPGLLLYLHGRTCEWWLIARKFFLSWTVVLLCRYILVRPSWPQRLLMTVIIVDRRRRRRRTDRWLA